MHIKATIVAYAYSVQYFKNTAIVSYMGLVVKVCLYLLLSINNEYNIFSTWF